jgi:hypothetical protein
MDDIPGLFSEPFIEVIQAIPDISRISRIVMQTPPVLNHGLQWPHESDGYGVANDQNLGAGMGLPHIRFTFIFRTGGRRCRAGVTRIILNQSRGPSG